MSVRSPVRSAVRIPTAAYRGRGLPWQSGGVPAAPVFVVQPQDQSVVEGEDATFSGLARGFPKPTYQWQLDSGSGFANISGATSRIYTTPALTLADDGNQYRCVATNSEGSATSSAATLTVTESIWILASGSWDDTGLWDDTAIWSDA